MAKLKVFDSSDTLANLLSGNWRLRVTITRVLSNVVRCVTEFKTSTGGDTVNLNLYRAFSVTATLNVARTFKVTGQASASPAITLFSSYLERKILR